jgi:hypothetical protein
MMSSTTQPTYLSYLLRLWRDGEEAPWRASLESVSTGEIHRFGDMEAMWRFLRERLERGDNEPP